MNIPTTVLTLSAHGGGLSVALWSRDEIGEGGRTIQRTSIKLQKSFKDAKTGEWRRFEINLFASEWPGIRMLGDLAFEHAMIRGGENGDDTE
ncbi:MAG: hypothetical protein IPK83_22215 [Planctomycetes bacterium]|nr:hypothetical protein [Planctomycetota bacterium]